MGNNSAARIPMMAMTTSSSMSVKAARCVGQTFLSAGSGDFPVARRNTGLESPVNRQAGKPAPHSLQVSHSSCNPLFLLAGRDDEFQLLPIVRHLSSGRAFLEQRASGASVHAFATERASLGFAPRLVQVGDDPRLRTAARDVFG